MVVRRWSVTPASLRFRVTSLSTLPALSSTYRSTSFGNDPVGSPPHRVGRRVTACRARCGPRRQRPPLAADPERLHQILDNLLDNAVKYAPAGSTITASARLSGSSVEAIVSNPAGP